MRKKRHTPEEIVSKLRQVDELVAQGTPVGDAVRTIGVTEVAWPADMNRFICRSRRRVGWCEFSALLFRCYGVAVTGWHDRRRK